ncbi:MAG: hypothetical protein GY703_07090, partial [Gammaproteobacteria bacterium]|nr:hypothetical protein [Gammaproteobacteria bacterium]
MMNLLGSYGLTYEDEDAAIAECHLYKTGFTSRAVEGASSELCIVGLPCHVNNSGGEIELPGKKCRTFVGDAVFFETGSSYCVTPLTLGQRLIFVYKMRIGTRPPSMVCHCTYGLCPTWINNAMRDMPQWAMWLRGVRAVLHDHPFLRTFTHIIVRSIAPQMFEMPLSGIETQVAEEWMQSGETAKIHDICTMNAADKKNDHLLAIRPEVIRHGEWADEDAIDFCVRALKLVTHG